MDLMKQGGANSRELSRFISNLGGWRAIICAVLLGMYVAFAIVFGGQLEESLEIQFDPAAYAKIAAVFLLAFFVSLAIFRAVALKSAKSEPLNAAPADFDDSVFDFTKFQATQNFSSTRAVKLTTFGVLMVPQLIIYLLVFPGIFGYDGDYQIFQFVSDAYPVTTQYSVFCTVLWGVCYQVGQYFGSAVAGYAVAMALQAFASIVAVYFVVIYLTDLTHSKVVFCCSLCLLALHPFAVLLRVSSCQDVLFGAFFMLSAMELLKLGKIVVRGEELAIKRLVPLAVFSVLMMLMRNNGSYVFLVMVVLSLPLIFKRRAWRVLLAFVATLLCFWLATSAYSLLGVQSSQVTLRELSSVPSQQLARALDEHPECFTQEQREAYIRAYAVPMYGYEASDASWYWSQCEISDWAKARLDQGYVKANLGEYLWLYTSVGLKCKRAYLNAFLLNTLGYWYPLKDYPDWHMYHPLIEYSEKESPFKESLEDLSKRSVFGEVDGWLESYMDSGDWSRIPVLSIALKPGFLFLMFALCLLASIVAKRSDRVFLLGLCAGLIVSLLLSPVCLFRYCYPLLMATPLLFSVFAVNELRG